MNRFALSTQESDGRRQSAESVLHALNGLVDRFAELGEEHPHHIHRLFCELYVCTAKYWLHALEAQKECEYPYRLIVEFYLIYQREVVEKLDRPFDELAANWRSYHRLARRLSIRSPITLHLLLLSAAVRAHVHLDLGVAMHRVERDMQLPGNDARQRARLFGTMSDKVFFAAALEFIDRHRTRQTGWRWWVLSLYRFGLFGLKPVWLLTFQNWRKGGYEKTGKQSTVLS